MQAAVYKQAGKTGDVLEVIELPTPEPAPGEVRVRIACAGLNPTDWKRMRTGPLAGALQVPCQDGAGTIDAVGSGVDPSRLGERVVRTGPEILGKLLVRHARGTVLPHGVG